MKTFWAKGWLIGAGRAFLKDWGSETPLKPKNEVWSKDQR